MREGFFEALAFIMDEGPHGLVVDLEALCLNLVRQALQRIVASLHPDEQPITPRADDLLGSITANFGRRCTAGLLVPIHPLDHR